MQQERLDVSAQVQAFGQKKREKTTRAINKKNIDETNGKKEKQKTKHKNKKNGKKIKAANKLKQRRKHRKKKK